MVTNTTLYITEQNFHLFKDELIELRRQAHELLSQVRRVTAMNESRSVIMPDRLLKQERLLGRISELDWLLKHVRPAWTPEHYKSVIQDR